MTDSNLRYVGTAAWSRVVLNDDGSFKGLETVKPGEKVNLPEDVASVLANPDVPRKDRTFVVANSDEDPYREGWEAPGVTNGTPNPELDMGTTDVAHNSISDPDGELFSKADLVGSRKDDDKDDKAKSQSARTVTPATVRK